MVGGRYAAENICDRAGVTADATGETIDSTGGASAGSRGRAETNRLPVGNSR